MRYDHITQGIIKCAIEVHRELGPGLLENIYQECLFFELLKEGLSVQKEKVLPVIYKSNHFEIGYRIDLLVRNSIVIELKSVSELSNVHLAQIITYLKLGGFKKGLLINFNVVRLKDGIKRVIL